MNRIQLKQYLHEFQQGKRSLDEILTTLERLPFESLDFATIDHHRSLRQGFPEVIFCEGKTPAQVAHIGARIAERKSPLLATRASREHYTALKRKIRSATFHPAARVISAFEPKRPAGKDFVLVVTAGTSDIPVAEEAMITIGMFGHRAEHLYDVGVAGIHRILTRAELLRTARAIIVVAGMEGALASVVGGLVSVPVIAVPTSVGYGANYKGLSALLGMLNSCAAGVTVVNIDNGFGAGFAASVILNGYRHPAK